MFYYQVHDAKRVVKGCRWLILMGGDEQEVHHKFKPETTYSNRYESAAPSCSFCVAAALAHPLPHSPSRRGKNFPRLKWKCGAECFALLLCGWVFHPHIWLIVSGTKEECLIWEERVQKQNQIRKLINKWSKGARPTSARSLLMKWIFIQSQRS